MLHAIKNLLDKFKNGSLSLYSKLRLIIDMKVNIPTHSFIAYTFIDSGSGEQLAQARNDNVRLPGSPYTALDTVRGRSAGPGPR